jgi:BNR/Asp-box repeat
MSRRFVAVLFGTALFFAATPAFASVMSYAVNSLSDLSTSCAGQNAEVEQAVDQARGYVYEEWMGCSGIAFARSTDGGAHFSAPISVPGSGGSTTNSWDPAVTVAPDGTVYAAFMIAKGAQWYPVVAASLDHGVTFPQVSSLIPPDAKNWGDRDFIAVGPDGTIYVTWDYGPNRTSVTNICATNGSCAFLTGDLNAVMQRSTDGGKTWSAIIPISPGFPASGGDLAPLVIEPNGRIDVLYQGYHITNTTTYTMDPAYSYFTASTDRGSTWSTPIAVGPQAGTMSLSEWWIDDAIGIDAGGNLYAVWDTQGTNADGSANDIGWLSFSTNHGRSWSAPVQATPDQLNVPHIMEVVGGAAGTAYVSWLSNSDPRGYALYLRAFSTKTGRLSAPQQISTEFGDPSVWPGDTTGISALSPTQLVLSWGSATPSSGKKSDIFVSNVGIGTN